jgi:hypothetical protein
MKSVFGGRFTKKYPGIYVTLISKSVNDKLVTGLNTNNETGINFCEINELPLFLMMEIDEVIHIMTHCRIATIPDNSRIFITESCFIATDLILGECIEIKDLNIWDNDKFCLQSVKQNGLSLEYISNQTPEICSQALKQNTDAIKYINDPTYAIISELALENNKLANENAIFIENHQAIRDIHKKNLEKIKGKYEAEIQKYKDYTDKIKKFYEDKIKGIEQANCRINIR